jgi:hypothetical protein
VLGRGSGSSGPPRHRELLEQLAARVSGSLVRCLPAQLPDQLGSRGLVSIAHLQSVALPELLRRLDYPRVALLLRGVLLARSAKRASASTAIRQRGVLLAR